MAESKYGKYIVTELKENIELPGFRRGEKIGQGLVDGVRRRMEHVIWMDSEVVPGSFYSECVWFWPGKMPPRGAAGGPPAHTHPFDEVITFFGTNFEDPHDLCGEIELWLEDEKFLLTKSFLAYVPAGMKHCPLKILRIDRPIFHFTLSPAKMYG
jgi:hypothetical protein